MRLLHILILLGGVVGCYFVYQDYAKKEKGRRNVSSEEVKRIVADTAKYKVPSPNDDFTRVDDAPLYRLLAVMRQAETKGYSATDTALQGAMSSGVRASVAKMIAERLSDNYAIARKLGVFDELANVLRMERGLPPVAHAKGWEDQPLAVGYILSPVFAPEASHCLANLVLMPEIARNMQMDDVGGFTFEQSKKWLNEGLITPDTHQAILAAIETKRKKGF